MKIKTTKQMRLDELIKHIIENEITDRKFRTTDAPYWEVVEVKRNGVINIINVSGNRRFTIQTEEELTEETILPTVSEVFYNLETDELITENHHCQSVNEILVEHDSTTFCLAIFNKVGDSLTLIWSKDTGIPAEGVIEV